MSNALAQAIVDALRADDVALDDLRALICVETPAPVDPDPWITAEQAAAYLGFASVQPLHKLTSARAIPFEQDGAGCKLYFKRSELDAWRKRGGGATYEVISRSRSTR